MKGSAMGEALQTDIFISHHPHDGGAAQSLAGLLKMHGVDVVCDAPASERVEHDSPRLAAALQAKIFVAWITADYCGHVALQHEFMTAFAGASIATATRDRIVLIDALNPREGSLPSLLRIGCHVERAAQATDAAKRIAAQSKRVRGPLSTALPNTARANPPRDFVGRIGLLWHMHEALSGALSQFAPRSAQLIGEGGSGKSWLADQYATAFQIAYPGGIFRLDAGWFEHPSADELRLMRERVWRDFARGLELEVDGSSLEELEQSLKQRLDASGAPYLWIVDHMPAGQSPEAVQEWFAPTSRGATLLISRSDEYAALAPQIVVAGIEDQDATALFAQHKAMATPQEVAAGRQLVEQLGHHALAVHLTALRLASGTYDRMLLQLAAPTRDAAQLADSLAGSLPHPQLVGICVALQQSVAKLTTQGRQALRLTTVLANAPVPLALLTTALAQQGRGGSAHGAVMQTQLALDELLGYGLARKIDDHLVVPSLVRSAVLAIDMEQELASARELIVAILAGELPQATETLRNPYESWIPHVLHIGRTATPSSQLIEINGWLARFDSLGTLRTGNRRAVQLLEQGNLTHAQQLLDMELAARRIGCGENHPSTVTPVNNLAVALSLRGEFPRARVLLEQAIEVRRKALGDQHADLLTPLNNLGVVLWHEGEHEKARRAFERVVDMRRHLLGDEHPETLVAMRNLAVALRHDGEYVAARSLLEHVVQVRAASLGQQHVDTCTAMASLAETLRQHSEALLARISGSLKLDSTLLGHDPSGHTFEAPAH